MTRLCYDSTAASDIPATARIVGGYVDGLFKWSDEDWARFPDAVKVRIACFSSTNDGQVGDVEKGDMTPEGSVGWVVMRRGVGIDPTIYCSRSQLPAVRAAFQLAGVAEPHYWLADYGDGVTPRPAPPIPDGAVALQYEHEAQTGGHYDLSVVADFWPGVEDHMTRETYAQELEPFVKETIRVILTEEYGLPQAAVETIVAASVKAVSDKLAK